MDVERSGPQRRVTRFLEDDRLLEMTQPQATEIPRSMWRKQASLSSFGNQAPPKLLTGAVDGLPPISLQWNDFFGNELPSTLLKLLQFGGNVKIHVNL